MVKCSECGFLALRNRVSWELLPSDPVYRKTAVIGTHRDQTLHSIPVCFAMAVDLQVDIESFEPETTLSQDKILRVTQKERECSEFTRWQLGFTPKEHREMMDRERMLDREERRDSEQRRFQERQEERADQRHTDQLDQLKGLHSKEMLIVGVLVTLVIVVSTIIGAGIEAEWIPKWFGLGS